MAFSRTVAHSTASDATFSATGATAWNGTSAHTPAVAGADIGGIPYCPTATSEATSANLTYSSTGLIASGSERYLSLPGTASNYASSPNAAPLQITGDIEIQCRVALTDWTPAAYNALVTKDAGLGQRSYGFLVDQSSTGKLILLWFKSAGATVITSTVAPTVADGATIWVRATLDVDNGAAGSTVTFYTAPDSSSVPTAWTQLGSPVVTAGVTSIDTSTALLEVGRSGNYGQAAGNFYRARVLNGIGGTVVFDSDFTGVTPLASSFTESSSNAATVTINAGGTAFTSYAPAFISGSLLSTTDIRNERVITRFVDSGYSGDLNMQVNGISVASFSSSGSLSLTSVFTNTATYMARSRTTFTNNAAAQTGTLTNAPAAGNPTKWIGIDDNGTTRYIPAW